jgi:deoxyribodipyrimidine photo-lyase
MPTAIALFSRDLRVHDNPVLAAAARAERTLPLFVLDERIAQRGFAGRNRDGFLSDCLSDLDASLRARGGALVVRAGEVVEQVMRVAEQVDAAEVHLAADVSGHARRREARLRVALAGQRRRLVMHDGSHTVLPPGAVTPAGSDHFAVFTPYWRRWSEMPLREVAPAPRHLRLPVLPSQARPHPSEGLPAVDAGRLLPGGESAGRRRAGVWLADGLVRYADRHDALSAGGTSRLSPYLHFGCVSALDLVTRARRHGAVAEPFVRQLVWRDFHAQVMAARPESAHADYRPRRSGWHDDPDALDAWRSGQTGIPIVDAGMRQLAAEGWMHNRARMITASFLTKTLGIDRRAGAAHFFTHLLDGDIANNCLNWQWVAGTGTDTRPNRTLNPLRQASRFDPDGEYVRRWVPELAGLPGAAIHQPWRSTLPGQRLRYPDPIVPPPRSS